MMRPGGITVALAVYWLAGVVGAASLPSDDQYSPQPSPSRRVVAHGPRGYPNWLEYRQDSNMEFGPPETKSSLKVLKTSDLSWESIVRKDTVPRDPDLSAPSPRRRKVATIRVNDNFSERGHSNLGVPEDSDVSSDSREDAFAVDDTFQDQGPGSVEVYKLDLRRENALLVPEARMKHRHLTTKSKVPKKAPTEEILWKLKPIEPSKVSFPAIFRRPLRVENRKDEVFAVGGVPELQVGCEGLEATDRRRRSSGPGKEASDEDSVNWQKFKIPVYKESTEPILSRVTPIVLDLDEEPPSGEAYEEMDELLKLKNLEATSPTPTTRRRNRADIDPALTIHHGDDLVNVETFPERGDLGPVSNGSSKVKRSIRPQGYQRRTAMGVIHQMENDVEDDDTSTATVESRHGGRKLLWMQYPERQEVNNQGRSRNHQADNDLWGFGEDDGVISGSDDDSEAERLRKVEMEKRRREDERRRQEELERRRGSHGHRSYSQDRHSENRDVNSEAEKIRMEYERQLEKEQRERQRIENERRGHRDGRNFEEERRITEDANRRREEESRRRLEEDERNSRNRPSPLTRPDQPHHVDNRSRSRQDDKEAEERKLREYIERNRPIDPKSREDRRRPEGEARWRNDDEERRRQMEEERRRQLMEEHRRRQQQPDEDERRRQQMEEHRRRQQQLEENERRRQMEEHRQKQHQPDEEEIRRQMEEHRRRQHQPDEEERRRQMEEHRRRQHQPDEEKTRRQMEEHRRRQHQRDEQERRREMEEHRRRQHQPDEEERRRQMEEQRRAQQQPNEEERRRQMEEQRRGQQQPDEEERRRQMEEQRRRQQLSDEYERRRQMEEQRRRPDEEERVRQMEEQRRRSHSDNRTMEDEKRRRLEEERKLQDYVRRNQPVNVPRRNNSEVLASQERDLDEQRRTLEAARQYERNRVESTRMNTDRSHGPSAPTNIGHRQSHTDLEEIRRRQEADTERRRLENEERKREEEYRRTESRRREGERRRLEETRRNEENRESQSESQRPSWHDSGSPRRPASTQHRGGSANPENEWRRRSEERERQRQQQQERERVRIKNERNSQNNGRRRPQHEDTGFNEHRRHGGIVGNSEERRRREHARLNSLPVSARIVVRSNDGSRPTGASQVATRSNASIDTRANFDNDIDFPPISPHRPGLSAGRFPVPATRRPPVESPGACVWAIVQCCPAKNRLTMCFESMGCPGINWDPNPCRGSLADAAQAEVVRFYEAAEEDRRRF